MKLFTIILVSLMLSVSTTLAANEDFFLGVKYNNVVEKNEIYKIDQKTGVSTLLKQFSFPSGYWQPGASFMDSYNGNLYLKDSNGQYLKYNYVTDTLTTTPAMDSDFQTMFQTPWAGSGIVSEAADGSVHIGENSLVTIETDGKQQLYATNSSGDQIDINIKNGTNFLINGTNVLSSINTNAASISTNTTNITANTGKINTNTTNITANTGKININTQDIHGSVALSSAMSALPNSSEDATSTCGMGTGFYKGLSAISAGCAMDFSTLTQNENLSPLFKRASVNLGTSAIMNSTGFSNFALRAGLTFKLGAKKSSGTDLSMNEDLQRYSTGTNTRIAKLQKENDALKAEMDALNAKLDALIASLNNG
jgi:hypothetical protein